MHGFHSPYRCQECDTRFWVLSRKTRLGAVAAGMCLLIVIVLAIMSSPPSRYSARVAEPAVQADGDVQASSGNGSAGELRRAQAASVPAPGGR